MKTIIVQILLALGLVLLPASLHGASRSAEQALTELYGASTITVRLDYSTMELPALGRRKAKIYGGKTVTYSYANQSTAIFLETKRGDVKVFVLQAIAPMDYTQIQDLRDFVRTNIADESIMTYVTPDKKRFEAISERYADEE